MIINIIGVIVILAGAGLGIYVLYTYNQKKKEYKYDSTTHGVVTLTPDELKPDPIVYDIKQIHNEFTTEVDRLLEYAGKPGEIIPNNPELLDKSKRLRALGFTQTKEIQKSIEEERRLEGLQAENYRKQLLFDAINYFKDKYPNYKFITIASVDEICKSYGLIRASVDRYIGAVPDENLEYIEKFKIAKEDELYEEQYCNSFNYGWHHQGWISYDTKIGADTVHRSVQKIKCSLEIVATPADFKPMERVYIDPIVLCPVLYKETKYYLIVTAWGK